jgi:hypothetical protein
MTGKDKLAQPTLAVLNSHQPIAFDTAGVPALGVIHPTR